jgi:MerR family transcriptional regulator/heat shock protein HspR
MMERGHDPNGDSENYAPRFVISVATVMVGVHPQTLRQYERVGLVEPRRTSGRQRLYSQADIDRLRTVQRLVNDLGVNLAGVDVILRLNERIREMELENEELRLEVQRYRERRLPAPRGRD